MDSSPTTTTKPEALGTGFYLNAGALFDVASTAYQQVPDTATAAVEMPLFPFTTALISIVFAAAALEAFINEASAIADYLRDLAAGWSMVQTTMGSMPFMHYRGGLARRGDSPLVHRFAALLRNAEESRASTALKYELALTWFSDQEDPLGRQPYQDFSLLFDLRNLLMHGKQEKYDFRQDSPNGDRTTKLVHRLVSRQVGTRSRRAPAGVPFLSRISDKSVAGWACDTAAAMVQAVISAIPEGDFKTVLAFAYGPRFHRVTP